MKSTTMSTIWTIDPNHPQKVRDTAGRIVALAYSPRDGHLIAAAPEMLDVLKTLISIACDEDTAPMTLGDAIEDAQRIVDRAEYSLA